MPLGYSSLDNYVRGAIDGGYPNFGQIHWIVDSDYRTQAQGWSRADRTGPLDLLEARRAGSGQQYVFRTGDYGSDSLCIQAAIDAMVDFRGDALYFTPGSYSLATALTVDVPSARWLAAPVRHPLRGTTTITAAIDAAIGLTGAADDMEIAFLRFVPLTAAEIINAATGCDGGYIHDCGYDTTGIAASTATIFLELAGTHLSWWLDRVHFITDAAQGPLVAMSSTSGLSLDLSISNFRHWHTLGTIAASVLNVVSTGAKGIIIGPGEGVAHGVTSAVTAMVVLGDNASVLNVITVRGFYGSVGYATVSTLLTASGTTLEASMLNNYLGQQKSSGAGGILYTG